MSQLTKQYAALIFVAALVATGVASYLAWQSVTGDSVAACAAGDVFDCESVLASEWSRWLGLPVAALGAGVYLAIVLVVWWAARNPYGWAMQVFVALVTAAGGSALWFIGLQLFALSSFCLYCLIVHALGLAISGMSVLLFLKARDEDDVPHRAVFESASGIPSLMTSRSDDDNTLSLGSSFVVGLAAILLLVGGQTILPSHISTGMEEVELPTFTAAQREPGEETLSETSTVPDFMDNDPREPIPTNSQREAARRLLNVAALANPVDVESLPLIGNPDSEHVIIEMLDYTCSHCRSLHPRLLAARERYGDQVAVALWHTPLDIDCNDHLLEGVKGRKEACDYAQLALGVWRLAPREFAEYHNWLMEGRLPPPIGKARQKAIRLVGDRILLDRDLKSSISADLGERCEAWSLISTKLPVLLFPDTAVQGGGSTDEEVFHLLEQKLGIAPIATTTLTSPLPQSNTP